MAGNGKDNPSPRFWVIAAGIAVGTGLVGYGAGRLQASAQTRAAEQRVTAAEDRAEEEIRAAEGRHEAATKAAREDRAALESTAGVLAARQSLLESRRQLGLVLHSLDDRNFGIASRHLEGAATELRRARLGEGRGRALLASLSESEIVVSSDLGEQRREIRSLVDDFDRLIDALPPVDVDVEEPDEEGDVGDDGPVGEPTETGPGSGDAGSAEPEAAPTDAASVTTGADGSADGSAEPAR